MFRQGSCQRSPVEESGQHKRLRRPWRQEAYRQEARREAVLRARRPVGRPSCAPGGPSGGRLGRQEDRREAVLGARSPVGRLSWGPEAVLAARRPKTSGFIDSSSEIVGFAQSAAGGSRQAWGSRLAKFPRRQASLPNFCIDAQF